VREAQRGVDTVSVFDLLVLSRAPGIGQRRLAALVTTFGTPQAVLRASARDLAPAAGIRPEEAMRLVQHLRGQGGKKFAELQLKLLSELGGRILTLWDSGYPELLRNIYDPPPLLFVRGRILPQDALAVAVVGTRHPSPYGRCMAGRFAAELASRGITVVSGLARGIDAESHAAALSAPGGRTVAVMGSGLDVCYPPENRSLLDRIADSGALVTEQCMGAKPLPGNFPRRNRIISGLSLGTLVVESDIKGGAMITAQSALEQNREVFALPGSIASPASRGCHALIREGRAKLVEGVEHILEELPVVRSSPPTETPVNE
jgi:DNA processing protein